MNDPVIDAIRQALDRDPRNGTLWLHYADLLAQGNRDDEALAAVRAASEIEESRDLASRRLVTLLRKSGQLAEALIRAEALLATADDPELQLELVLICEARGDEDQANVHREKLRADNPELLEPLAEETPAAGKAPEPALASVESERPTTQEWASQFDWGDLRITLDDVVGLDDVKRQINLRIIAPFKQPEIYEAFARDGGGGLLLYGPPGCGKTYIARATAGELGARFVSVSIHEIVDKYWGESEKLVHALFEDARRNSPTVLFFDEFDALGSKRGQASQFWKTLVDQLLQEMDGVSGGNRDVLLLAATNVPWSVDPAFRRPGRFDRVLFVPPPDEAGRKALLERHSKKLPGAAALDLSEIAGQTAHFTGADVKALCERAAEEPLERSLTTGEVHEIEMRHFREARKASTSTATEWFALARNHARYANEGGHYDYLIEYLKQIGKW